jgi:hypothetical protein
MNILEQLKDILKDRVYASFFKGGSKPQEELTVVRELLESMANHGEERYFDPSVSSLDPPDCIASGANGAAVAIEVTEIVCEQAVRINAQRDRKAIMRMEPGVAVMRAWNRQNFISHVSDRLVDKDTKKLNRGPYEAYVIAMHTDEPDLERDKCEAWLHGHAFGPFKQICDAYLLFSYKPIVGYPYLRIQIAKKPPHASVL